MEIEIDYDGKWPNLCSGHLVVTIDGKVWDFGEHVLISGGYIVTTRDWNMWAEEGEWSINEWPENFPEELKDDVLEAINTEISHGCCGGCI